MRVDLFFSALKVVVFSCCFVFSQHFVLLYECACADKVNESLISPVVKGAAGVKAVLHSGSFQNKFMPEQVTDGLIR